MKIAISKNLTKPLSAKAAATATFDLPVLPLLEKETRQTWVYRLLREAILRGSLQAGMRVPSSRALSRQLEVSRSTVEVAFDQLRAEGYVSGVVGSGTYVSAALPDQFLRAVSQVSARKSPEPHAGSVDASASATLRSSRLDAAFVARIADPTLFPLATWRKRLQAAARSLPIQDLMGGELFGLLSLRAQVARYLGAARGIACDPAQIVIVTGIRQALHLAARALLKPSDKVLLEDPGYVLASDIFAPYAQSIVPVAIDASGFSVADARRHADARAAHITPAHQSPTGVTMPVARRLELLNWAKEQQVWLLEDDYDSEFNYRSAPLPALKNLDQHDRVIHCGSFNKTMFSELRIGYMVVPHALLPAFALACRAMGPSVGVIEQRALASFIEDGGFARHVRRSRIVYASRRERVLASLREAVAPLPLHTSGEHGGFHFVWWLPECIPLVALLQQANARGLRIDIVADHCRSSPMPPGILIGDSALSDEGLDDALVRLREAIAAARVDLAKGS